MNNKYIVAYLDVYGFKDMVPKESLVPQNEDKRSSELLDNLIEGHKAIQDVLKKREAQHPRTYVFSDSIALCYEVNEPLDRIIVAKTCLGDVRLLLDKFVTLKLPLRGGVAFGEMIVDKDILIGQPLIRAAQYEAMIDAPIVLLPEHEISCNLPNGYRSKIGDLQATILNIKNNQTILARPLLPRHLTQFKELIKEKFEECMQRRLYYVATAWYNAMLYVERNEKELSQANRNE